MNRIQTMRSNWGITGSLTTDEHRKPGPYISTYHLAEVIGELLEDDDVLATGCSGLATEIFQLAVPLVPEREVICNFSMGAMGYGIPTAIGACIGSGLKRTIAVDGDGGFYLNIQDLATIKGLNLPIKFFVLNNGGYASMRTSNEKWFGRKFGADEESGLHLPNLGDVVRGFGLPFAKIDGQQDLKEQVVVALTFPGPLICQVPSPPYELRPPAPVSESKWVPTTKFRTE